MDIIPYARQSINEDDIQAVTDVLRADYLTQGPAVSRFETTIKKYCGANHALAVASATAGLHLIYMAFGLGKGDILWTSPNTYVATANAALYCGAEVDFIDIDPKTYNISVAALKAKLEIAEKSGHLPKIVVPVHIAGMSCDMAEIHKLSKQYGFKVVEDAAHAIGGEYDNQKIGDCRYSDACVFSFHPVKIITSGEGGMITTNDAAIYEALMRLRTHGVTRDAAQLQNKIEGPWHFEQLDLGYHYRLTDIQAALGNSQLKRVDQFVHKRNALAQHYRELLDEHNIGLPIMPEGRLCSWHLYVVQIDFDAYTISKPEFFEEMKKAGILVNLHYMPVYLHPYYQSLGFEKGLCPIAEAYYARAVSLPLYYDLTSDQQAYVAGAIQKILK